MSSEEPAAYLALRRATAADWPAIASLLTEAALPLAGAESRAAEFVVAERRGRVAGCAGLERYGTSALLRSVAVVPNERGQGIGIALVDAALDRARQDAIRTLVLLTTTAAPFFERFGFRIVTRDDVPHAVRASEEFRGACPASATVMRLDLAAPAPNVA